MALPYPVIVVPGITASFLKDEYPVDHDYVWTVFSKDYERIALHPNDLRYEATEPARVTKGQLFEIAYNELVEELRFNLKDKEDKPVPVFPFGYDWRMPLETIEKELDDFVNEVIDRTKLINHYHKDGFAENPKVNIVAHSMGGLIVTGYLEQKKQNANVNKVVTLATPFHGSFEAVIKISTGTANLGASVPGSREREAARLTPSLYHLLPDFKNGITASSDLPNTLFEPGIWQKSIFQSLEEFIRLKGLHAKNRKKEAEKLLKTLLDQAKEYKRRINNFNPENAGLDKKNWLAVVGVDSTTRVKLKIKKIGNSPSFEFRSDDRKNEWDNNDQKTRRQTGDGTVPFDGAVPSFLNEENLVCVTPSDFGYWEIQDRTVTKFAGFHGILPNMNMLHRLIVRFFKDRPDKRGNTWGRPAPGVLDDEWNPPLKLRNKNK